jgi:hypothetical protein
MMMLPWCNEPKCKLPLAQTHVEANGELHTYQETLELRIADYAKVPIRNSAPDLALLRRCQCLASPLKVSLSRAPDSTETQHPHSKKRVAIISGGLEPLRIVRNGLSM